MCILRWMFLFALTCVSMTHAETNASAGDVSPQITQAFPWIVAQAKPATAEEKKRLEKEEAKKRLEKADAQKRAQLAEQERQKAAAQKAAQLADQERQKAAAQKAAQVAAQERQKAAAQKAAQLADQERQKTATQKAAQLAEQERQKAAAQKSAQLAEQERQKAAAQKAAQLAEQERQKTAAQKGAQLADQERQKAEAQKAAQLAEQERQKAAAQKGAQLADQERQKAEAQKAAQLAEQERQKTAAQKAAQKVEFQGKAPSRAPAQDMVKVPNVVNMERMQMVDALIKAGLRGVSVSDTYTTDGTRNFIVASQKPAAGQNVQKGSIVEISLFRNSKALVTVPSVVGATLDQAKQALATAGLNPQFLDSTPTTERSKNGTVFAQDPAAGQIKERNWPVSLSTYRYQQFLVLSTVPNVVSMDAAQAATVLKNVGLKYHQYVGFTRTTEQSKNGKVAFHNPAAGQNVEKGSAVTVSLYQYQQPPVPNVVGMTLNQAKQALAAEGLKLYSSGYTPTTDKSKKGTVSAQNPAAGQDRASNSDAGVVAVSFFTYTPPATVPNLMGMSQDQATKALEALGLKATLAKFQKYSTDPTWVGKVAFQNPVAGLSIANGHVVELAIWATPIMVTVPDLVNLTVAEAHKRLDALNLYDGVVAYKPTAWAENHGKVAEQLTKPGTSVKVLQTVAMKVWQFDQNEMVVRFAYEPDNKRHLAWILGGARPFADVYLEYDVPKAMAGQKIVQITLLPDQPSKPGWKFYRVTSKIAGKATLVIKDARRVAHRYPVELKM